MLLEVTYATEDYRCARIFNNKMALRYGDVDAVKGFSWDDIPNDFKEKNKRILDIKRGAGC
ncbi:MAG: hypothetical protein IJU05_08910, partial [Schwartzia sp.]|nr:hypothetical protein [Schwartzia sp. (in: firmicutes)]